MLRLRKIYLFALFALVIISIYFMAFNIFNNNDDKYQQVTNISELDALTVNLLQAKKENNVEEMTKIASEREGLLFEKLTNNPKIFLTYATLTNQRINFPEQVRPYIEEEVSLRGRLVIVVVDDYAGKKSKTEYVLESSGNRFSLHFTKEPSGLASGAEVSVKGIKLDSNIVLDLK